MRKLSFKEKVNIRAISSFIGVFGFIPIVGGLMIGSIILCIAGVVLITVCSIVENNIWRCSECGALLPIAMDGYTKTQCEKCGHIQTDTEDPAEKDNT